MNDNRGMPNEATYSSVSSASRHFGMWPWLLQRITGALLIVYIAGHIWIDHYAIHGPITFQGVAERLRGSFWRNFDIALLGLVLYHGLNGIRIIILDFNPGKSIQKLTLWGILILGIMLFIYGMQGLKPFSL